MSNEKPTTLDRANAMSILNDWFEEYDEQIKAADGEVPEELHELLQGAFPELKQKIEGCASMIGAWQADLAVQYDEIERLQARRKSRQGRIDSLRRYMLLCMDIAGEQKIDGTFYTVSVKKTPAKVTAPDTLTEAEAKEWPELFVTIIPTQYKPDKGAIKEAWQIKPDGPLPAGVSVTTGKTVAIR